jgi:hypothetical protein
LDWIGLDWIIIIVRVTVIIVDTGTLYLSHNSELKQTFDGADKLEFTQLFDSHLARLNNKLWDCQAGCQPVSNTYNTLHIVHLTKQHQQSNGEATLVHKSSISPKQKITDKDISSKQTGLIVNKTNYTSSSQVNINLFHTFGKLMHSHYAFNAVQK